MKQVFNWTIGSFFRTIGRTIAFLLMGGLIYYILSSNGFEFGIRDLFFDKVSAASSTGSIWAENWSDGDNWTINSQLGYMYTQRSLSTYTNYLKTITISNNSFYVENHGDIYISGYLDGLYLANQELYCSETSDNSQGGNICTTWNTENLELAFQIWIDNYNDQCTIDWNIPPLSQQSNSHTIYFKATCQTHRTEFNKINYQIYVKDTHDNSIIYNLGFNRYIKYDIPTSQATVDAINQQTQQQQQQHEEMMDDNTTQAESEATDFFEDFDAPDIGGLGAIITAPLNTIRSLLNSSCTNLVLPLPFVNKSLTLPCMNTIYTQHFGAFFTIYQTIILAIIAYRCIRSIFFDIHGFTNPNDDRIEVMDL